MHLSLPFSVVSLSFVAVASAQNGVSVTPAAKAAQASGGASGALDPSFCGMGIEASNLYSFTGGSDKNDFSINLMTNLGTYSGRPPHLRIGGNTEDNMVYQDDMTDWKLSTNQNPVGQGTYPTDLYYFGPTYWEAINRFPADTPITFGLNLAYEESDYIDNIVKEAAAAVKGLTNVRLVSFEIGNEPDLYLQNGFRNGTWGGPTYTQQFLDRAAAVCSQVLQPNNMSCSFFEPAATASTIGTSFEIKQLDTLGITANANGSSFSYIAGWNQHDYFYFTDVSTYILTLQYLMNIANTESQFEYWTTQVSQGLQTGLPYFLREMASAGPTGIQGITDTFGASLWNLNFFLYAATLNISSVEMHMTDNSFAAPWQPGDMNNMGPNVRPSYYAFVAMAQLIGSGNGTTQVAALTASGIPGSYTNNVRMYSVYANSALSAMVFINTLMSNASNTQKGSLTFTVSLPDYKGQTLFLSTLTADGADVTNGTSWNGMSFESSGDGTSSTDDSNNVTTVNVGDDGSAQITVRDSQAVVANIGSQLGKNAVLTPNGTTTAPGGRKTSGASSSGAPNAAITSAVTTAIAAASSTSGAPNASHTSQATSMRLISGGAMAAVAIACAFVSLYVFNIALL